MFINILQHQSKGNTIKLTTAFNAQKKFPKSTEMSKRSNFIAFVELILTRF